MDFNTFAKAIQKAKPRPGGPFAGRLLALDPGETTGWSIWVSGTKPDTNIITGYDMEACGQLPSWDKVNGKIDPCVKDFPQLLLQLANYGGYKPTWQTEVVLEAYRVYEWKTESHAWSDVPTLRIIGSMETRIQDRGFPYHFQTAQQAKNFVTDEKLKEWGFYEKGQRHSRDSMRHALYYLLFGNKG